MGSQTVYEYDQKAPVFSRSRRLIVDFFLHIFRFCWVKKTLNFICYGYEYESMSKISILWDFFRSLILYLWSLSNEKCLRICVDVLGGVLWGRWICLKRRSNCWTLRNFNCEVKIILRKQGHNLREPIFWFFAELLQLLYIFYLDIL